MTEYSLENVLNWARESSEKGDRDVMSAVLRQVNAAVRRETGLAQAGLVDALIDVARHETRSDARLTALRTLKQSEAEPSAHALEVLTGLATDRQESAPVRAAALEALGAMGLATKGPLPRDMGATLHALSTDHKEWTLVRGTALEVMHRLAHAHRIVIPADLDMKGLADIDVPAEGWYVMAA
ncbi:MAG: HEAT repeat domain-containing protein [Alphaproteobacteria bacterium]|nr:MAG: HEAT repeat domain-containing protein [Alphaproteobacteria bacterium]